MPLLILMRHAKSDWDAGVDADHERPLAPRGIKAAHTIGTTLAAGTITPDLIVSSTAVRARSTAALTAEAAGWDVETRLEPSLYGASVHEVVELVRELNGETVMVVGHQPTFGATVSHLTGGSAVRFPTAATAGVDLRTWHSAGPGAGELQWMLIPRLLTG